MAVVDVFTVVADPTRRRILDELRGGERTVGQLVDLLRMSQPSVSKHLKVLREGGFVASRASAQQRIYRLEGAPLRALDAWLEPYRRIWNQRIDALENYLEQPGTT